MASAGEGAVLNYIENLSEEERNVAYRHLLRKGSAGDGLGWFLLAESSEHLGVFSPVVLLVHLPHREYFEAMTRWFSVKVSGEPWPRDKVYGFSFVVDWFQQDFASHPGVIPFSQWMSPKEILSSRVRHTFGKKVCEMLLEEWASEIPDRPTIAESYKLVRECVESAEDWDIPLEEVLTFNFEHDPSQVDWEETPMDRPLVVPPDADYADSVVGTVSGFGRRSRVPLANIRSGGQLPGPSSRRDFEVGGPVTVIYGPFSGSEGVLFSAPSSSSNLPHLNYFSVLLWENNQWGRQIGIPYNFLRVGGSEELQEGIRRRQQEGVE